MKASIGVLSISLINLWDCWYRSWVVNKLSSVTLRQTQGAEHETVDQ